MSGPLKWILLLIVVSIRAQDPRRRGFWLCQNDYLQPKVENNKLACFDGKSMTKRFDSGEIGPFWANRGKKDPLYLQEPLYAEEPYWIRSANQFQEEPFYLSRGKKEDEIYSSSLRETRDFVQDHDAPFFAARGKKLRVKN